MSKFVLSAFGDEIHSSLDIQIRELKKHNIGYIDMRGVDGKGILSFSMDEIKKVKIQLDENGIKVSSLASPIGKILIDGDFEKHFELFKYALDVAEVLETKYIRMFSFFINKDDDKDIHRDCVMERWSRFVKEAENRDVILLHENEKDIYGDTAERHLDVVTTMKSPKVRSILDPANYIQVGVEVYPHAYELVKDTIEYLHIKDAKFETGHVTPFGHGDGKVKEVIKDLHKRGFEGFLSIEPHLDDFAGFQELERGNSEKNSEGDGIAMFEIAVNALKKIIEEVEGECNE